MLQVCIEKEAKIEVATNSINMVFEDENTDAILLVDASSAFNSLKRELF